MIRMQLALVLCSRVWPDTFRCIKSASHSSKSVCLQRYVVFVSSLRGPWTFHLSRIAVLYCIPNHTQTWTCSITESCMSNISNTALHATEEEDAIFLTVVYNRNVLKRINNPVTAFVILRSSINLQAHSYVKEQRIFWNSFRFFSHFSFQIIVFFLLWTFGM